MVDISTIVQNIQLVKERDRIDDVTVGEFHFYRVTNDPKYERICRQLINHGLVYLTAKFGDNLCCQDIEDAVSDGIADFIEKMPTKEKARKSIALRYFKGICYHKAVDISNKLKKRPTIRNSGDNENHFTNIPNKRSVSDELIKHLTYEKVIETLKTSPELHKYKNCITIFELRRLGYKHAAIDTMMKREKGWSKVRKSRCLKKIKAILSGTDK